MSTISITADEKQQTTAAAKGMGTVARGTGLSFFAEVGHVFITYAYGILIARFLGTGGYGIFFLGITIFNLICLFALGGVEDALLRFLGHYAKAGEKDQANAVIRLSFGIALTAGLVLGLACFLLKDLLANQVFHKPELAAVIRYLSIAIPVFSLMTVSVAAVRGYKIVLPYVFVRKIFLPGVGFCLAILILLPGFGLAGLSITYLMSVAISACLGYILLSRYLTPFNGPGAPLRDRKGYFSFLGTVYAANILIFLFTWSDLIILGIMAPSEQLGIYFAAKKTALALGILLVSLNVILGPVISHLYSGNQLDQLGHAFKTATQWIVALGLPVLMMILFFPGEILSLFGPAFTDGRPALMILACGQFINLSVGSVGYMLLMTGHQTWMVINALGAVCLNIPLMIFLVSRYGITGAACATGITMALANIIALAEVYFLLGLHPYSVRYLKLLLLAVVTAGAAWMIHHYLIAAASLSASVPLILAQVAFIFIAFFLLLICFGLNDDEKQTLTSIRKKPLPVLLKGILEGRNG